MNTCIYIYPCFFGIKGIGFFWLYALSGAILGASFVRNVTYGFFFKMNHIDNQGHYD
jgi:hypothetical protein